MKSARFLSEQEIRCIFPKTAEDEVEPTTTEIKSRDLYEDLAKKMENPRGQGYV